MHTVGMHYNSIILNNNPCRLEPTLLGGLRASAPTIPCPVKTRTTAASRTRMTLPLGPVSISTSWTLECTVNM